MPNQLQPSQSFPFRVAAFIYEGVIKTRNYFYSTVPPLSFSAGRPTISIGGVRAGGTGKTPVALMVGNYLRNKQINVAFLSRGYGRKKRNSLIVAPDETVKWEDIGDEPALLRNAVESAWLGIGGNRVKSARLLSDKVPQDTVFILDDAFQHRRIRRDIDIICLHETFYNDTLLPCGYLREPLSGVGRAHAVCLIGTENRLEKLHESRKRIKSIAPSVPCFILHYEFDCWVNGHSGETTRKLPIKEPVLVCGIARPQRFAQMVRSLGVNLNAELFFPDHHIFFNDDLTTFQNIYSYGIVTTEKDAIRLRSLKVGIPREFWYLKIKVQFCDVGEERYFYTLIDNVVT